MPTVGKQSSLKRSGLPFAGRMTIARWLARKAMQFLDRVTDGIGRPWWLPVAVGALLFGLYDAGSAQSRKPSVTFIKFVGSEGIFGKDNRREPPSKYKDLTKSVGRLDTRIGQKLAMCTAFCVADSVVATAAHCLFIPDLGANFSNVSIAIGQGRDRRTTKIHGRTEWERQSSVIVGSPFQKERPDVAHDWALVRLGSPVCKDRALRLSTIDNIAAFYPKALEKDVFLLGYHTDLNPGLLRYSDDCLSSDAPFEAEAAHQLVKSIGQDSQDALPHRCDTFPGASGGPIFWDSPDGPSVVGVNSAVLHNLGLAGVPAEHRKLAEQINANAAILANAFEKQIQLIETTPTPVDRGELKLVQELLKETGHYNG